MKPLKENTESELLNIGLGNDFFGYDIKCINKNKEVGPHLTKKTTSD